MIDLNATIDATRRRLLAAPAAFAAALALPPLPAPVASAEPVALAPDDRAEPEVAHSAACFHDKFCVSTDDAAWEAEYHRHSSKLRAELADDQWATHARLVRMEGETGYEEQDRFVDELCRHFPSMAPAIWAAAYHARDDGRGGYGACCMSAPDPVAEVLGRMAETIAPMEVDRQERLLALLEAFTGDLADAWGYRSTCRVDRRTDIPQDAA